MLKRPMTGYNATNTPSGVRLIHFYLIMNGSDNSQAILHVSMPTHSSIVWHMFSISERGHIDGLPHHSNLNNTVTYRVQTDSCEIGLTKAYQYLSQKNLN